MSMPLPLTQKQPEHWLRKPLRDCFQIHTPIPGGSDTMDFEPGDILVRTEQGKLTARVVDQACTEKARQVARLRSRDVLLPELMVLMINHRDIQATMRDTVHRGGYATFGMNVSALRDLVIGVPDPQTQQMMVQAVQASHRYLVEHNTLIRKQADTLDRMADAILHEVLLGKADAKEALRWVGKALSPWLRMGEGKEGVPEFSAQEAGQSGPEARFVRVEDHADTVARLQARVRELEAGLGEPTPSRRGPSP